MKPGRKPMDMEESMRRFVTRFWERVDKRGEDECWPWTGCKDVSGYGRVTFRKGRMFLAHRLAYTLASDLIPEGLNVLHHCDNPPCCNPKHLFLGTYQDNTDDMMKKGRHRVGASWPNARLALLYKK